MKRFLKGCASFLAASTFSGLLFATATLITLWSVFAQPTTMKGWLRNSGIYSSVIDEIAKQTSVKDSSNQQQEVLGGAQITKAAESAFTPQTIQTSSESIIDSIYGWLQGETTEPTFSIDLSQQKSAFVDGLGTSLIQKISSLPACTGTVATANIDPTSLTCLPKNLDIEAAKETFVQDFSSSSDLLPDNKISNTSLGLSDKIGAKALKLGPKVYLALLWAPWVSLGFLALSVTALIALSTKKRKGIARVARGFVFSGALLTIVGVTLVPATKKLSLFIGGTDTTKSITQNIINPLLEQVWQHTARLNLIIGLAYMGFGLGLYLIVFLTREKHHSEQHENENLSTPQAAENYQGPEPITDTTSPENTPVVQQNNLEQSNTQPTTSLRTTPAYTPRSSQYTQRQPNPTEQTPPKNNPPMVQG